MTNYEMMKTSLRDRTSLNKDYVREEFLKFFKRKFPRYLLLMCYETRYFTVVNNMLDNSEESHQKIFQEVWECFEGIYQEDEIDIVHILEDSNGLGVFIRRHGEIFLHMFIDYTNGVVEVQ